MSMMLFNKNTCGEIRSDSFFFPPDRQVYIYFYLSGRANISATKAFGITFIIKHLVMITNTEFHGQGAKKKDRPE